MPPRARPGRTSPEQSKTLAKPNTKSGQKAKQAADRTQQMVDVAANPKESAEEAPVFGPNGPLTKLTFAAAELIPTGDFANVSLGPVVATVWIDPLADDPIPQATLDGIAQAGNKLAETVLRDVCGVQRNIILEALQDEATEN
jgi:hypothetical protein